MPLLDFAGVWTAVDRRKQEPKLHQATLSSALIMVRRQLCLHYVMYAILLTRWLYLNLNRHSRPVQWNWIRRHHPWWEGKHFLLQRCGVSLYSFAVCWSWASFLICLIAPLKSYSGGHIWKGFRGPALHASDFFKDMDEEHNIGRVDAAFRMHNPENPNAHDHIFFFLVGCTDYVTVLTDTYILLTSVLFKSTEWQGVQLLQPNSGGRVSKTDPGSFPRSSQSTGCSCGVSQRRV